MRSTTGQVTSGMVPPNTRVAIEPEGHIAAAALGMKVASCDLALGC